MYKKDSKKQSDATVRVGLIGHQFMGLAHSNAYRNAGIWYDLPCKIEMTAVCAKDLSKLSPSIEGISTNWICVDS